MEIKTRREVFVSTVIDKNSDVLLTITVGNAQIGGNIVKWKGDSDILKKGAVSNLNLGKGSDIVGKKLEIFTNILDVNTQTNGVVTTNYFHNATDSAVSFADFVDNDGDVFSFEEEVQFI